MGDTEKDLEQGEKIGKIGAEVHALSSAVNKLFDKFDDFVERTQPKSLSIGGILGIATSIFAILAVFFGSVIYITNSANAPISTQLNQSAIILQSMQNNIQQNTSFIQLTNKEVSGIKNMAHGNEDTLRWMIFEENLPKQITILQKQVDHLISISHLHKFMTEEEK